MLLRAVGRAVALAGREMIATSRAGLAHPAANQLLTVRGVSLAGLAGIGLVSGSWRSWHREGELQQEMPKRATIVAHSADYERRRKEDLDQALDDVAKAFATFIGAVFSVGVILVSGALTGTTVPLMIAVAALAYTTKPSDESFGPWFQTERRQRALERDDYVERFLSRATSVFDIMKYEFVDLSFMKLVYVRNPMTNSVKVYAGALHQWMFLMEYDEDKQPQGYSY